MVTQLGSLYGFYVTGSRALPMVLKSGEGTSGASMSSLTDSMVSGLTDIANQLLISLGSIVPAILIVVGGVSVVAFGIKIFKKFAK